MEPDLHIHCVYIYTTGIPEKIQNVSSVTYSSIALLGEHFINEILFCLFLTLFFI